MVGVVAFATALVFVFGRLLPGDPALIALGDLADPSEISSLRQAWGLDRPVFEQFWMFLKRSFSFNWGLSFSKNTPIESLILEAAVNTFCLVLPGVILSSFFALIMSYRTVKLFLARKKDYLGFLIAFASNAVPVFVLGPVCILFFSIKLHLTPVSGSDSVYHYFLPTICLAVACFPGLYRHLKTSMLVNLEEDYIRTARAKGLSEARVLGVHLFKNSAGSFFTALSASLGSLLGGAVVTETIFDWPGLGKLFLGAFYTRDYPLMEAVVFVSAGVHVFFSFISDVANKVVDPRASFFDEVS